MSTLTDTIPASTSRVKQTSKKAGRRSRDRDGDLVALNVNFVSIPLDGVRQAEADLPISTVAYCKECLRYLGNVTLGPGHSLPNGHCVFVSSDACFCALENIHIAQILAARTPTDFRIIARGIRRKIVFLNMGATERSSQLASLETWNLLSHYRVGLIALLSERQSPFAALAALGHFDHVGPNR